MQNSKRKRTSFDKMCSMLVKEPYNLSLTEIGKLTPYQTQHIYFRSEEDDSEEEAFQALRERRKEKSRDEIFLESLSGYKRVFYESAWHNGVEMGEIHKSWKKHEENVKKNKK